MKEAIGRGFEINPTEQKSGYLIDEIGNWKSQINLLKFRLSRFQD